MGKNTQRAISITAMLTALFTPRYTRYLKAEVEAPLPKSSVNEDSYEKFKIAFGSNRDGNDEIYVMNVDGSGQRNLTRSSFDEIQFSWAPAGNKMFLTLDKNGDLDIYVMNVDGSGQKRLTSVANNLCPALSRLPSEPKDESGQ